MDTVTISLNGRAVAGVPGTTILDLARQVGERIPTLCHHPLLRNAGACRVCLVEEAKSGRLFASCVTPIADGMEILTNSDAAIRARRGVLELILSDHPSACVVCSKGNECVLRSLAKDHGICDPELEPVRRWRPTQEVNPFITRDLTKCVLCGRCIRVCKDHEAVGAVDYLERGYQCEPGTSECGSLERSECNFCGSCIALCPTDALAERYRLPITSGVDRSAGICPYCGTGCHVEYGVANGVVVSARGTVGTPVNGLSLCVRGRYGQDAVVSPARLTSPMMRDEQGGLSQVSWDEGLREAGSRLKRILEQYGPGRIGVIVGTHCSNEEHYLACRFARSILKTPHLDSTARFSSGAAVQGLAASLKRIRPGATLDQILESDVIVMVGARPDYTHPVIARNIRFAVRNRGADLVQIDSLKTTLSAFARIRFTQEPDRLLSLLVRLMKELVARNLYHGEFVTSHVANAAQFLAVVAPDPGAELPEEEISRGARLLGRDRKAVFLIGSVAGRATQGYILTRLVVDLALLCGQPEKVFYLYKGCNELGAWKMGCRSERLPGGWIGEQREALECLKRMWGDDIASTQGLNAMEMLRSCEKKNLKALFLLGVDPLAVFPDTERTRKALAGMDLLIRTGTFPATGEELAHLVFPSAVLTETDGTYMNVDGRVQRSNKVANPPGGARPLARFLLDLAGHLDAAMSYPAARDIFEELCGLYEGWNALTWASVGRRGGVIPELPGAGPSSTDTSAVAEARPVPYIPPDQFPSGPQPPPHRPFRVFPEERTMYPGDGVLARRSWRLSEFDSNVDQVRMHPADCQRIGVRDGERVELRSEAGSVTARLGVDDAVPPRGVVVPSAGPSYMFQRLLSWPEQHCPVGWDRLFVSVTPVEE